MKKHFSSYWIRSAFYTFLQRFSITFFGFINFILLTRKLSTPEFGVWTLFLTITGVFELAKSNLLKNAHIKFVSGSDDTEEKTLIASSSFLINLFINILFILFIVFFADWLGAWLNMKLELSSMLRWFIPGLIFMVFFTHFEATQQSHLDFKGVFAGYFIRQILFFLVILIYKVFNLPLSLTQLVMYQTLSVLAGSVVLYFYSRKYLAYQFKASWLWIKKILGYGGYIFGSGLVANIYSNLDPVMIAKFVDPASVGYYSVPSRISSLIDIPSYAAADILFPKASRASVEEGKEKVKYLFERMVAILMAFTIPATIFIIIFPHFVTTVIAGKGYLAAVPILQLYMVASIFRPVQNQAANLLNSIGKAKLVFIINTATVIALLIINYICLKQFGFYGAAIGTLITSLAGFVAWYYVMKKEIDLDMKKVFGYAMDTYKMIFRQIAGLFSKNKKQEIPQQ